MKLKTSFLIYLVIALSSFCVFAQDIPTEYCKELVKMAREGDVEARLRLGDCYQFGYGIPKNFKEAVRWYRLAAEDEHPQAQVELGYMYSVGRGVPQNYQEAFKWYDLAARQGHVFAQYDLGICYLKGHGVTRDPAKGMKWLEEATQFGAGDPAAMFYCGFLYYDGKYNDISGIAKDYDKAFYYLSMALDSEDTPYELKGEIARKLSACYRFGRGVAPDERKADELTREAVKYGTPDAKELLSFLSLKH